MPAPWPASVHVAGTEVPGEVEFSVPTTPEVCATTIGGALVRIDFHNLAAGRSSSVTVNPCGHAVDPAPVTARAQTGTGFIQFGSAIVGSAAYPNAGQPAIPGTGSFLAP